MIGNRGLAFNCWEPHSEKVYFLTGIYQGLSLGLIQVSCYLYNKTGEIVC